MDAALLDALVRRHAFEYLDHLRHQHGDVLPYHVLRDGFRFQGERVPLLGPQGIFKPAVLSAMPLSLTTAPPHPGRAAPYDDELGDDGMIRYRYRGTDPSHRDNAGLRRAMACRVPLVYFYGIVQSKYLAQYPTFVVADDPDRLTFLLQVDQAEAVVAPGTEVGESVQARREYITRAVKVRLHQAAFRERVLTAYRRCCAMCRLRHAPLLDAAHIIADRLPQGLPLVSNGLSHCKLHHAAFDRHLVGVRPDGVVQVARSILDEEDGPMLRHGLQGMHGQAILLPRRVADHPNRQALEQRFEEFRASA